MAKVQPCSFESTPLQNEGQNYIKRIYNQTVCQKKIVLRRVARMKEKNYRPAVLENKPGMSLGTVKNGKGIFCRILPHGF
ncbi:MAG: hypothetical protein EGP82_03670 [Odoribacter splanchnicus]|nr:hypothetical protein [Odoribacter splanchnicus]